MRSHHITQVAVEVRVTTTLEAAVRSGSTGRQSTAAARSRSTKCLLGQRFRRAVDLRRALGESRGPSPPEIGEVCESLRRHRALCTCVTARRRAADRRRASGGALGVLDFAFANDQDACAQQLDRLARQGGGRFGVHVDDEDLVELALAAPAGTLEALVVGEGLAPRLAAVAARAHTAGLRVLATATTVDAARAAEEAGADAVIAKGHEAGGWVGEESTVRSCSSDCAAAVGAPGLGPRRGRAAHAPPHARSPAPPAPCSTPSCCSRASRRCPSGSRRRSRRWTAARPPCLGAGLGAPLRVLRPARSAPGAEAADGRARLDAEEPVDRRRVARRRRPRPLAARRASAIGQDAAFAADLAERFGTVGGILCRPARRRRRACAAAPEAQPARRGLAAGRSRTARATRSSRGR